MLLTGLVRGIDHVCCRYRLAAYRPYLEQAGHSLDLKPWPRRAWNWLSLVRALRRADAVVIQRQLPYAWQLHLLRKYARLLLFDFDDAVFLRDSYALKGLHNHRRLGRFTALVGAADAVIAGNTFLGDKASAEAKKPAIVIPTCVDPLRYPRAPHVQAGRGVELVWIGSASTLRGLETQRPVLEQLGQHFPGLRLKIVCDRHLELRHLPVLACPWSEAVEGAALAAADIGISWMPDDLWSRGKCGLKVLQYMAAGLPVVANPVGIHGELIQHGITGFLAETSDEWVEAIGRLAHDPALRRNLGNAGRQVVEDHYSVASGAARWLGLLNSLSGCDGMTG